MRLFIISATTLVFALIIGLIVRFWGLSLPYKKFEHPFLEAAKAETQPLIIPVFNIEKFKLTPPTGPDDYHFETAPNISGRKILWVNFYITSDRILVTDYNVNIDALLNTLREQGKFKGKYIHNYTRAELTPYAPMIPLADVVAAFPDHHFIFNILSNELDTHKDVIKFIEERNLGDKVLINSPIDVIIGSIKEQKPMWVYGTSLPEATRVKSFSTLGLEPAISVRGDVFIAPISYMKRPLIDESLVTEMKRRKKVVLIGPLLNEEERKQADELNPDGIIF